MMRPLRVLGAIAAIIRLEAFLLLIPIPVALHFSAADTEVAGTLVPAAVVAFVAAALLCTAFWAPLLLITRRAREEDLLEREGVLAVGLGWLVASLFASVPFLLMRTFEGPTAFVDASFEAMSALTGTGASAIPPVTLATVDASILLWRAILQFVGAMLIIVLFIALLSRLHQSTLPLVATEAAGHLTRRLRPKLAETVRTVWMLYVGVAAVLALAMTAILSRHLPLDRALLEGTIHVMAAYSTGGLATSASILIASDGLFAGALVVCMLLGATNFSLLFLLLRRRDARVLGDAEWRFWMTALGIAIVANTLILLHHGYALRAAARDSAFTLTAFSSGTAGLAITDYSGWPSASLLILTLLMFMGGMAGSAAGGIKGTRWLVLFKMLGRELRRILHPRAVIAVRIGGRPLKEETLASVAAFFFTYLAIWAVGTLVVTATDSHLDLQSGAFAAAATLGNAGGGIGAVGPALGYAALLPTTKVVLTILMWAGRLELFAALLLFNPSSWRN